LRWVREALLGRHAPRPDESTDRTHGRVQVALELVISPEGCLTHSMCLGPARRADIGSKDGRAVVANSARFSRDDLRRPATPGGRFRSGSGEVLMASIDQTSWPALSVLLDQLLELPPVERSRRLTELRADGNSALA